MFSLFPAFAATPWAFVPFLIGHLIWIRAGWAMSDRQIVSLNAGLAILDLAAIALRIVGISALDALFLLFPFIVLWFEIVLLVRAYRALIEMRFFIRKALDA